MRVNIVPVGELLDQHLRAEYVEILMLSAALTKTLASKDGFTPKKVPANYKLGDGHAYFFFNKGRYIHKRYLQVSYEMLNRGFEATKKFPRELWPDHLYNDWEPDHLDFKPIRNRIAQKYLLKPDWYLFHKKKVTRLKRIQVTSWL